MATWKHQNKYRYEFTVKGVRYGDSGYATKREAKEAEAEHRKRLKKRKTKNLKFKELCDERLTELKARCTHHYYDENEKLIDKLLYRWSYKTVIERKDVRNFLNAEKPTMANKYLRFIRALFNFGTNECLIDYDPTKGIKFYPVDKKLKYIPPIEDITKVLAQAKPKDRDFLLTLAYTMARISEIRNLKWSDIYEDHLILRTRKSKNSNLVERSIPLPGPLKEVIDGIEKNGKYVFTSPRTGSKYVDRKKLLIGLCRDAKVKRFSFHAFRHYGASKLAQEGVPLTDIQALLGHSRATTTDLYLQSLGFTSRFNSISKLEFPA